jgi:hypothetical protein
VAQYYGSWTTARIGIGTREELDDHPDRYAQFQFIDEQVCRALAARRPVISLDTRKKELLGNYRNAGRQWRATGRQRPVKVRSFRRRGYERIRTGPTTWGATWGECRHLS